MGNRKTTEQQLFETVYNWGRVGIVTDYKCATYKYYLRQLKKKYTRQFKNKKEPIRGWHL